MNEHDACDEGPIPSELGLVGDLEEIRLIRCSNSTGLTSRINVDETAIDGSSLSCPSILRWHERSNTS